MMQLANSVSMGVSQMCAHLASDIELAMHKTVKTHGMCNFQLNSMEIERRRWAQVGEKRKSHRFIRETA